MLRSSRSTLMSALNEHRPGAWRRPAIVAALGLVVAGGAAALLAQKSGPSADVAATGSLPRSQSFAVDPRFLDPRPAFDVAAAWPKTPVPAAWQSATAKPAQGLQADVKLTRALPAPLPEAPAAIAQASPTLPLAAVPLPIPRPADLGGAATGTETSLAGRRGSRRPKTAEAAPAEDNRSFFEKVFGAPQEATPRVAYAALDAGKLETAPQPRLSPTPVPPPQSAEGGVAVYDISARTVTLPSGEKLEAHSGLGDKMDDARFVHLRMRGATPPGTYDLTEREALFHGVRALRLNPVGGSSAIHGRAGLLTHTYLLGPGGDSNGCISFRNYDRFLQAYLRGEVKRVVVVPGTPSLGDRLFGFNRRARPADREG